MNKSDLKALKKYFGLTTIGVILQSVGSLCMIIASISVLKMINSRIKEFFMK